MLVLGTRGHGGQEIIKIVMGTTGMANNRDRSYKQESRESREQGESDPSECGQHKKSIRKRQTKNCVGIVRGYRG